MIRLLDCTLRDGGYYTNWDFEDDLIKNYFSYIEKLPVEYVEVGYICNQKNIYHGKYFYLSPLVLKNIRNLTDKKLSVMINAKDWIDVDFPGFLLEMKKYISLIRIATDPDEMNLSLDLAEKLKTFGFDVALNIMYISKIHNRHKFFNYINSIENIVDYLYLVDSYGSILPSEFEKIIKIVKSKTNVTLGFHGHNNIEMAFINSLKAIENGVELIDCTVLGMGRGAGNLKTELILTYLKSNSNFHVDLNILGKLTQTFQSLFEQYKWGTNLAYMVSGSYSLPQKNVMESLELDRYSLSEIVHQLRYGKDFPLPKFKHGKIIDSCVVIGGGVSVYKHFEAIEKLLMFDKKIVVIHSTVKYLNMFKHLDNTQMLAITSGEVDDVKSLGNISKYVLEPTPRKVNILPKSIENIYELGEITFIDKYTDSPFSISLQIALEMKANIINLVGFDGYVELKNKKSLYLLRENQNIIDNFVKRQGLTSLTDTHYYNLDKSSIYTLNNSKI
jgi:4-hydroxy 2-oxovalerate aldolase